jgi:arylsulfatase
MMGNLSIYDHDWIAADRSGLLPWEFKADFHAPAWELYDLRRDYAEAHDLAAEQPAKLKQLQAVFDAEAKKFKVYPIDPSIVGRNHHPPGPPPGTDHYTYYGSGTGHLPNGVSPVTVNRTHTITALIEVPANGAEGVLVADGGRFAGYALYLDHSRPTYVYHNFNNSPVTITTAEALKPGPATIVVQFNYDGGGLGKGATVSLSVNGVNQASARLESTVPLVYSFEEAFDVGEDEFTPVGPYTAPFRFSGKLFSLELKSLSPSEENPSAAQREAAMRAQEMTQ